MAKYLRGTLKEAETFPSERARFNHVSLAWEFHEPRQAIWLSEEDDWIADLIDFGNARDARDHDPNPGGSVREQLGLPPPPAISDAQREARRAQVLALLDAKKSAKED